MVDSSWFCPPAPYCPLIRECSLKEFPESNDAFYSAEWRSPTLLFSVVMHSLISYSSYERDRPFYMLD